MEHIKVRAIAKNAMALFVSFPIKNKLIKPVKGFLYPRERQGKVQSYMAWAVEWSAVLPDNADFNARRLQLVDRHTVTLAPLCAIKKQHIGALGASVGNSLKMLVYIIAGIVHILGKDFAKLVHPRFALLAVGTDECVH